MGIKGKVFLMGVGILTISMVACNNESSEGATAKSQDDLAGFIEMGANYTKSYCLACHAASGGENNRIAPPMIAVREHYLEAFAEEKDFVDAMIDFLNHPSKENAQMPGAVRKFGLMPKLNLDEDKLFAIATYLFHEEQEEPKWWREHRSKEHGEKQGEKKEDPYFQMAMATKKELGRNLMMALEKFGAAGAVDFCHTRALPITDSVAQALKASIKRVSDQARNPLNEADEDEKIIIAQFKKQWAQHGSTKATEAIVNGKKRYYYSIETQAMCLNCHGQKDTDIKPETWKAIQSKYPNDQATGYSENQIRGMWVVSPKD